MKTWSAIGAIFTFIGVIVLIFGVVKIAEIQNIYNQMGVGSFLGSSYVNTLIWTAFEPYMIGAIVFFIIGGVGFIAGSSQKTNNNAIELTNQSASTTPTNASFSINAPNKSVSGKSTIICGSCGTVNDLDAIFCKKCGTNFDKNVATN